MIQLEGVRVHNLKNIDVQIPLHKLTVITGVSGSGKSSLAFDTLYAEGQRRYIETFSAYARQFLNRLERPDADRIDNIPPAIAIRQNAINVNARSTVATATEIHDHLRLLFARIGKIVCPNCDVAVQADSVESIVDTVKNFAVGDRFQVCFPLTVHEDEGDVLPRLLEDGFTRLIVPDADKQSWQTTNIGDIDADSRKRLAESMVIVDRLVAGKTDESRLGDSVEQALQFGQERCVLLKAVGDTSTTKLVVDGRDFELHGFNTNLVCESCQAEFTEPQPSLFSFNSPLGACPNCEGFGSVTAISFDHLVPDPQKTLREGAIAAWTTPAYEHELEELIALADDYGVPLDVPFEQLETRHLELIRNGVPERDFGGLVGFFRWLERNRYKTPVRVFLSRWRSYEDCPDCGGSRLSPATLAVQIQGTTLAQLCQMTIERAAEFFDGLDANMNETNRQLTRTALPEIRSRLNYLRDVGLQYLTMDRRMRTLSGGEAQRVALTAALGSNLVNTLYVLDEPSAGLHRRDSDRVIDSIMRLRDTGNTVVVVEHEDAFVVAAEHVIDIGPTAGRSGGEVIYTGDVDGLKNCDDSITGRHLQGDRKTDCQSVNQNNQTPSKLRITGARQHTLKNLTVEFPLGILCVVTGVSGSGKSTLVEDTLYPALCRALRQPCSNRDKGDFDVLEGTENLDEVILVDQSPVGRSSRSNPVTFMKAFDEVRKVFADTPDARLKNFKAGTFSFNTKTGGRCPKCEGHGTVEIDMQFLADVAMTCPECHGCRYVPEVLEIKYRGRSIAEVLDMTVGDAFSFFRGETRLQKRLKFLIDVGLDYVPLGQPANTLSGGESQRLRLASFLAAVSKSRTLFILNEPTIGLHAHDVTRLLDCFQRLIAVGHSLIVVEHNLDVIRQADHIIDLGPDAGENGGRIVATGTPTDIANNSESKTGQFL